MSVRESRSQRSFNSSTGLFAVFHALRRRLAPRHPPHALSSLTALTSRSPLPLSPPRAEGPGGRERPLSEATVPGCIGREMVTIHHWLLYSRARKRELHALGPGPTPKKEPPRTLFVSNSSALPACQRAQVTGCPTT